MTLEHKCYASRTNEVGQHVCDICKTPINTMNIEQIKDNFRKRFGAPLGKEAKVIIREGSDVMLVGYNDIVDFLTSLQAEHEREMGELVDTAWEYCVKATRAENWSKRELQEAIATRRGLLKELDQPTV